MARSSDYVRIPQQEDEDDSEDDAGESPSALRLGDPNASSSSRSAIGRSRSADTRSSRSTSGRNRSAKIDLRSLDTAFKRWTQEITQKVRRKKKSQASEGKKEIVFSVFQPLPNQTGQLALHRTLNDGPPMTDRDFNELCDSVKIAILDGIQPKLIEKGSSGSYFARRKVDGKAQVVGVFKPKDEEYGHLNPKTTKWIHRNFFWWVGFGRACLIPNLSYISEAAASLLDQRLDLGIVPTTKLVSLSSPVFSYGWIDRMEYKKGKALPEKVGSMQTFMHGYQDATAFLREHPWPGRTIADTYDDASHRSGTAALKRCSAVCGIMCGRTGEAEDDDDYDEIYDQQGRHGRTDSSEHPSDPSFSWTPTMQQEFREELERLVILDFLMRNTDRGLDNFMIKYCEGKKDKTVVDRAPTPSPAPHLPSMAPAAADSPSLLAPQSAFSQPSSSTKVEHDDNFDDSPHIHLAAIDNSLSFPHQHPKGWRDFTYGWLFLPVSLIGRPFSQKTRDHFLPLLSDPAWWSETTFQLRQLHKLDDGFNERMFKRQMALIKGQGWNVVQCLKHSDEGPLELTRRTKVLVWDDEVEVPYDATPEEIIDIVSAAQTKLSAVPSDVVAQPLAPPSPTPVASSSLPVSPAKTPNTTSPTRPHFGPGARARSYSISGRNAFPTEFPPWKSRSRRNSQVDLSVRPVPLSSKTLGDGAILAGATGVSVLEHLEKLDVVENKLNKVMSEASPKPSINGTVLFAEVPEEDDVGEGPSTMPHPEEDDEFNPDMLASQTFSITSNDSGPPPKPILSVDLGLPPRRQPKRASTVMSAVDPGETGPSLDQLLGADDLTASITSVAGATRSPHIQWANEDQQPHRHRHRQNLSASLTLARPALMPNGGLDALRRTRIVVAERLETVDARPFFSNW